jgi:RNA polymerase subunit RPABC4/transcription elongation factor Spt4
MTPAQRDASPDERVRFCLRCGAMVAFDERVCPACGHGEPLPGEIALVTCTGCERVRAATLQFCPECGREAEGVWPPVGKVAAPVAPRPSGMVSAGVVLASLAALAAVLAVILALRAS